MWFRHVSSDKSEIRWAPDWRAHSCPRPISPRTIQRTQLRETARSCLAQNAAKGPRRSEPHLKLVEVLPLLTDYLEWREGHDPLWSHHSLSLPASVLNT